MGLEFVKNLNYITVDLTGENSEKLTFSEFSILYSDTLKFTVNLNLLWCKAEVNIEVSIDRFKDWIFDLRRISNIDNKNIQFINEDGNFEIIVEYIQNDMYVIKGVLSKNMFNSSNLIYDFETKEHFIEGFIEKINLVLQAID